MASRRINRTKTFSSYLSSINEEVANLKSRADTTGLPIESGVISGGSLADELSLVSNGIHSSNYIPNYLGWRISGSGVAEFSDVLVRGDINAYSGTIGYWNISSPSVTRVFGDTTLYGTFLESSAVGDSDAGKTDGTYVALFKSYTLEPNLILSKYRRDNIATITTPGHAFIVGDLVYVDVTGDASFSALAAPVAIIETTGDTISYINEGDDFTNLDASDDPLDNTAEGTVTLYSPDVAGLYVRDYSKREFDYGYFSNTGVSYVSAEDINVIENPSFEVINSSGVLTYDDISWTAGSGLTLDIETFSTSATPFKNSSAYGGILTWSNTVSTYLSSTIDYVAGTAYQVFGLGRDLYFGATVFPRYTPPISKAVTLVETATLSNSFTSATANTTTITYTGSGLTFSAGQYVTVSGYADSRFNITAQKIATANATTVTVTSAGVAVATETTTRTATSKLLKVTTSTSHGLAAGETVFLDMDVVYEDPEFGGDVTSIYSPHTIPDGTQGYTFTVSASPAPTGSIVYLSTEFSTMQADGTDLTRVAHNNKDGFSRDFNIYKVYETALDLSAITISYPNVGTTTPIADVLSSGTQALWNAGIGKYLLGIANSYMLGYLDTDVGISALTNPNDIVLDGASIAAAYQAADPVGYAAQTDIKLNIPGWLILHDGNGVVPTSQTKISNVGYIIDDAYLSTASNFFYGSQLSTNRWFATTEDVISYDPDQASIEGTKTWLDINLENQSASLDYFDYIGFRNNTFGSTMLVRPSIGVYDSTKTYLKFPDPTYETTTVTGGQYQYLTATQYINVSPSLKLITGTRSVSFELAASTKNINLITGETSISSSAVIAGTYNEESNQSTIYVGSDKFVWTEYPAVLDSEINASVIFTPVLASFAQRIRTDGSISAGGYIITSSGNIRTLDGDIYTSSGDIYTSDGRVTATTARLTSTASYNLSSTTHPFQVGPTASANLRIDDNGIQTVDNGSISGLNINTFGGDVTIGNSSSVISLPGDLEVDGAISADGNLTIGTAVLNGAITRAFLAGGGTTGATFSNAGALVRTVSSARYKQDIEDAEYSYTDVLSLSPKTFRLKEEVESNPDARVYAGLIAEEVDQIDGLKVFVNYLAQEDGSVVPDGIAYGEMVSALVSALKHQDTLITSLRNRLDALEGN